ncbi:hypothetical protein [Desertivirga xinjiangensis]|uniref:hypothetical protein n=1 Tax=Desertivirga xinjiangensis TaxID=539206 RepID=UPI00210E080C|nr:hypothetical protein [Pedobacter xinjiangensis]
MTDFGVLKTIFYTQMEVDGTYNLDPVKLKSFVEMELWDIKQLKRRLVAELCVFQLRPYLNDETILKTKENKNFSDKQLEFFYETLTILELFPKVNEDELQADNDAIGKMRTALKNYIKWNLKKRSTKDKNSKSSTPN